jgi:hypothetical protein
MFGVKPAAAIRFPNYTSESLPPRRIVALAPHIRVLPHCSLVWR